MSGEVVLMTLLGGMGTIWGPVVGAASIVSMQNVLASGPLANYIHVVMGVVFVICVLAFRKGLVGELQKLLRKKCQLSRFDSLNPPFSPSEPPHRLI